MGTFMLDIYKGLFRAIKRGSKNGIISNAKPAYLIAIIDYINSGQSKNRFLCDDKKLKNLYENVLGEFNEVQKTPFNLPYLHLGGEPFYHIEWKSKDRPQPKSNSVPYCYLREHIEKAYLDNDLWIILQDSEVRASLRNFIISLYFKHE